MRQTNTKFFLLQEEQERLKTVDTRYGWKIQIKVGLSWEGGFSPLTTKKVDNTPNLEKLF